MKQEKKGLQLYKTALVISCVHFLLSFWTDHFIFRYVVFDFSSAKNIVKSIETCGVKLVFLFLLIAVWQGIFYVCKKADKTFKRVALGYFLLMLVLLLLTWPGIWRMDEFGILTSAVQLFPHFWQNYITSVFYIYALMLFPFPAGVILVQIICISLIIARLVTLCLSAESEQIGKKKKSLCYLLMLVPFLLLPVLDSNLYPMRVSMHAFLELWLLAELYFNWKKNTMPAWYLSVLAAVVTVWRTEAIYYVVCFPLLLLWMGRGKKYRKQILLYLICAVILFAPQKLGEKITSGSQYELTSVVLPLVPLVEAAHETDTAFDRQLLAEIDKVVSVEVTLEGAREGKTGINLFWSRPDFQRSYTDKEFASFKQAYYKLILRYPAVFLKERFETFVSSTGLLENTTELFTESVPNYITFRQYPLSSPISDKTRTAVIKGLELRTQKDYTQKLAVTDLVYSALPAVLILLVASVILLIRKKWPPLFLLLTALVKVPLVFLTAPSRLFMYYYSVYLIGYAVLFYSAFLLTQKKAKGSKTVRQEAAYE